MTHGVLERTKEGSAPGLVSDMWHTGDRRNHGITHGRRQCWVGLLCHDLAQCHTDVRGQDVADGLLGRHDEAVLLGGPADELAQHRRRLGLGRRGIAGSHGAVHERVDPRVRQPEFDVRIPPVTDVLNGITAGLRLRLRGRVLLEPAGNDCLG